MKSPRGWKRRFDDPIPLPRGRQFVTLEDARQLHHEASEVRANGGVAGRDGSVDLGRDVRRANDVCGHRRHDNLESHCLIPIAKSIIGVGGS